jgi:transcription termination factor NusB
MDMKKICRNQVKQAKNYERMQSEIVGYDIGEDAIVEWVNLYAKQYREEYKEVYEELVAKVQEHVTSLDDIIGTRLSDDQRKQIISIICSSFTDIWTKEMSLHGKYNKHIDEI